jgi:hypothetical protein
MQPQLQDVSLKHCSQYFKFKFLREEDIGKPRAASTLPPSRSSPAELNAYVRREPPPIRLMTLGGFAIWPLYRTRVMHFKLVRGRTT